MSLTLFSPNCPTSPRSPSLLLTVSELARLLTRSEASLLRDVTAGRIPSPVRIGRSVRWRRGDVEAWLAAGCPVLRSRPI